jgi:hypothetical protein
MAYEDVIAERYWAMPEGWKELKGAMTAPKGWVWAYNGKSVFQSGRKIGLVIECSSNADKQHDSEERTE